MASTGGVQFAHAQIAPAAPLIQQSQPEPISNQAYETAQKTKAEFRRAYNQVGKPKLAIFWNRKLDDQLSQWHTASRNIDTREGGWYRGKGFTATQNRIDVENRFGENSRNGDIQNFEFGSGFTRTLMNSGVNIVDRDVIMRLTHSEAKEAADNIIVADYQQIEIDALIGYADYLAEITRSGGQDEGASLFISIKEVKTGRLVAMFPSRNQVSEENFTTEWVTTDSGYRKVRVPVRNARNAYDADEITPGTPEHIGWSVAIETMRALTKYWRT